MAEWAPVIMTGVEIGKQVLDFLKERRKPSAAPSREVADLVKTTKKNIKPQYMELWRKQMYQALESERLSNKQFNEVFDKTIKDLFSPSTFYRDKLMEMNSALNKGWGKIDIYYTLISRSSRKVKDMLILQSRVLIPRINEDLNRFLAIMKKLDAAVIAKIQNNFCGAFTECESDLQARSGRLEDIQSIGADFSISDIEEWLHAYRDYIECCLEGVNKSIMLA